MKFDWHYSVKQWLTLVFTKNIYVITNNNRQLFFSGCIKNAYTEKVIENTSLLNEYHRLY